MDDIEALQAHLDRVPDDHTARLVLADRLEEAGSPLAEGYRALALLECHPMHSRGVWLWLRAHIRHPGAQWLPWDWVGQFEGNDTHRFSRREAEDAAAEAFARLPESRRRELLAKLYGG